MIDDEDDPERYPLRPDELARVRQMLMAEQRTIWLWATVRVWATWVAAVVLGATVGWDALKRIVGALR